MGLAEDCIGFGMLCCVARRRRGATDSLNPVNEPRGLVVCLCPAVGKSESMTVRPRSAGTALHRDMTDHFRPEADARQKQTRLVVLTAFPMFAILNQSESFILP